MTGLKTRMTSSPLDEETSTQFTTMMMEPLFGVNVSTGCCSRIFSFSG